jgi:hypothetical protein
MGGLYDDICAAAASEGVPSAVAAARDGVDALLRDRGPRKTSPALVTESLLRGSAASAQLEGGTTGVEDLRGGRGDVLARAAARLNAGLLSLVPVVNRSPLQALARLHTLAAVGLVGDDLLGRPRPAADAARSLQGVASLLTVRTGLPAVVVAAAAHAEIVAREPFQTSNGLVARALERLLLVAKGVDPTSMLVPEAAHLTLERSYRESLLAYASGRPAGRRQWLLHSATALTTAAEQSPLRAAGGTGRESLDP